MAAIFGRQKKPGRSRVCLRLDQAQATATGILPILACHSFGPVLCTLVPEESTATVTGMSCTSKLFLDLGQGGLQGLGFFAVLGFGAHGALRLIWVFIQCLAANHWMHDQQCNGE